jgi:hypothetical protein
MWARHVLEAERETRGIPRSLVRYAEVLEDWSAAARRIGADLALRWPRPDKRRIEAFLSAELRHHRAPARASPDIAASLSRWVLPAWRAFAQLAEGDRRGPMETLDRLLSELDRRRG